MVRNRRGSLSPGQAGETACLPLKKNPSPNVHFVANNCIYFTGCKIGSLLRINREAWGRMCTGRTSVAHAARPHSAGHVQPLRPLGHLRPALSQRHPSRAPHHAHGPSLPRKWQGSSPRAPGISLNLKMTPNE